MVHPLRTLLYELFAAPPLRLLQRALEVSVSGAGIVTAYVFERKNPHKNKVPVVPIGPIGPVGLK
jgi:hypothetical protein